MPFLRPIPFAKVAVVALQDDRENLLTALHDLGVVQVEPLDKETLAEVGAGRTPERQREVSDQLVRFRGLLAALPGTASRAAPIRFGNLDEIVAATKSVPIDDEVGALTREDDQLQTEWRNVEQTIDLLERFSHYGGRYDELRARNAIALLGEGTIDDVNAWRAASPTLSGLPIDLRPVDKNLVRFLVAVPTAELETISRLATTHHLRIDAPPNLSGTSAEELPALKHRITAIDQRRAAIDGRLRELSETWHDRIAALAEALDIENRKFDVMTRVGSTPRTLVLQGWVPRRSLPSVQQTLRLAVNDRVEVMEVPTHEEPPTLMENPPGVRRFEFLVRFYSLPLASEWDPTWVFAIAFPVFYGLMLGDWGYGIVILGFCLWMLAGFPGRKYVPKPLKGFLTIIVSPRGMQSLAAAILPGAILAIGLGLYFNSFFGAEVIPGYAPPFDPLHHVGTYLKIAGFIGIGMVIFGFVLGALKEYFRHKPRPALGKVGGIFATIGISALGLGLIYKTLTGFGLVWPLATLIAGVLLLIFGEGVQTGGMAVLEVLSHVLSYTRLIGILLASIILATVINQVALGPTGHGGLIGSGSVGLVVFGVIILLFGQVFNLVLGVFEPGIQGARLIFVEYFSKFYSGNGKVFSPLKTKRTRTVAASTSSPSTTP